MRSNAQLSTTSSATQFLDSNSAPRSMSRSVRGKNDVDGNHFEKVFNNQMSAHSNNDGFNQHKFWGLAPVNLNVLGLWGSNQHKCHDPDFSKYPSYQPKCDSDEGRFDRIKMPAWSSLITVWVEQWALSMKQLVVNNDELRILHEKKIWWKFLSTMMSRILREKNCKIW